MAETAPPSSASSPEDEIQGSPRTDKQIEVPDAGEDVPVSPADGEEAEATQPTTPPAEEAKEPEAQLPPSSADITLNDSPGGDDGVNIAADAGQADAQRSDSPVDTPEAPRDSPTEQLTEDEPSLALDLPTRAADPDSASDRIDELEAELRALRAERTAASVRADKAESALSEIRAVRASAADGASLEELEGMLLASSERAVAAAAKAKEYASRLQSESDGRVRAEEQLVSVRSSLVQGIAGNDADLALYRHAPLSDLVRLYGKEKADAAPARPWSRSSRPTSRMSASRRSPVPSELVGDETDVGDVELDGAATRSVEDRAGREDVDEEDEAAAVRVEQSLDRDAVLKAARAHNFQLSKRLEEAEVRERELEEVASQTDAAQQKAMVFASKLRSATNRAGRAEKAASSAEARVDALSQHVEKLMTHLEHEAGAKAKLHDQLRRADHTITRLKERGAQLARANQQRDRLVLELKEGAKILEDQLRLMDQKYVELRGKLDWLRSRADKEVKRARKQAEAVERAWLELQATGIIPISRKPPKMPPKKLLVGDPPGMPGADIPPMADSSLLPAIGASSKADAGTSASRSHMH